MGKKKQLDIWEDVLKTHVRSNLLPYATTVPQRDPPYDVQVFELLVAESLNLQDKHTKWEVTREKNDGGIDLLGVDEIPCRTPFTTTQFRLLSVGQVKRSKRSYKYDDFRTDIRKARGYWTDSSLFDGNAPKQFVFVLSTEGKTGVRSLQKHLKRDLEKNNSAQFKTEQLTHIQLIDASNIINSWKLNLNYFEHILENALTSAQLDCFRTYISGLDASWISASIEAPKTGGVGEAIVQTLLIEASSKDIAFDLYIKWIAPDDEDIHLLHPLGMIDPKTRGYSIRIHEKAEIPIFLRCMHTGTRNFGTLELYSEDNIAIAEVALKHVTIGGMRSPVYYSTPTRSVLLELEQLVADNIPALIPIAVSGCGGIGKSSLLSEVMSFAAQRKYCIIDIRHPKELLHPRLLLHRFFTQILRPCAPQNMFLSDLPSQIRQFLGVNFREEWSEVLELFFRPEGQAVEISAVVECMVSLLLTTAHDMRIFLWFSDMHWASRETLDILRLVVETLDTNQSMLQNRILLILEGRSGEVFTYDGQPYYAVYWEKLLSENLFRTYPLSSWSRDECKEFLRQFFVEAAYSQPLYDNLIEQLLSCGGGVPMHLLELVRLQVEQGVLTPDPSDEYRLNISRLPQDRIVWADKILDAIGRRIAFYRNRISDFVDVCAIFAALEDATPALLVERLMKRLYTQFPEIHSVFEQSGFLVRQGERYHFSHEYYQTAFRMQLVKSRSLLSDSLVYYDRLTRKAPSDRYSEIRLRLLAEDADYVQIRRDILALLRRKLPVSMQQSLYKLLLELAPLPSGRDLPPYKVRFLIAETYIREGSWKSAQEYLEKLISSPQGGFRELLIRIKAYQELSNILGDRLLFDEAINMAESGLELAEVSLKGTLTARQREHVCVEQEKLLARLAVCYWFSGNIARGLSTQRRCYDMAVARQDKYSAGHVLYEIGTLAFHFKPEIGIAIMEAVLVDCPSIPPLERYERTLIETQLLMGRLILAAEKKDVEALHEIRLECRRLLELNMGAPHSYEKFLCLTMRGICAFLEERDIRKAQGYFLESLRCAVESDMPNLTWKAQFHVAQMCDILEEENAWIYAREAKICLDAAIKNNPNTGPELACMLKPVLKRLDVLIGNESQDMQMFLEDTRTMISIYESECLFVIMN